MSLWGSLEARLRRLEARSKHLQKRTHIINVGPSYEVKDLDQLEKELQKPKYRNASAVIIDDVEYQVSQWANDEKQKCGIDRIL